MAVKLEIAAHNMDVTDRITDYVTKKISKLDRFISDLDEVLVDLTYRKTARNAADRQIAQITLRGKRYILRTEERSTDIFTAFDAAMDKMQRQVERLKGRRDRGRGDGTSVSEATSEPIEVEQQSAGPVIARRKSFTLVPMDEEEALEQMVLLGHELFFIFYNVNTNSVNVLYQRRDGTYGLIEPKIG
jgi:putative sigma-54 modulation protein